jgi:type II secretory pathway pseudopilin PulG
MTHDQKRGSRHNAGFTVLELSISVALLVIVSLLGFIASSGSLKSADLTGRMTTLEGELRATMQTLSTQVQPAVKKARSGFVLPTGAVALTVVNPTTITYVVPTGMAGKTFSGLYTIQFISEDKPDATIEGGTYGNGELDAGEDTDGDGMLDRNLVLTRPDGTKQMLGGANHLANVTFALSADGSMLEVTMVASMRLEAGKTRMLLYTLTSNIYLMN